jgi:hypothetical protein
MSAITTLNDDIRFALLALTGVPDLGPAALSRFLDAWRAGRLTPVASLELTEEEYRSRFRLRPDAITALTGRRDAFRRAAEGLDREMRERGIELVTGASLPQGFPFLFAYGNLDLCEEPSVTLLASSDADLRAVEAAERIADGLASHSAHLVSGHNRPGYKAAGVAARRRGAPLSLVLDRGLLNAWGEEWGRELLAPARVWDERFDREATLALSPFRLHDGWVTANARRRDQLVCGLARVLIAVALRPGGWLEAQCRAAAARGASVLLCDPGPARGGAARVPELPGARVVATEVAADAALQSIGAPGTGLRRAERRWRTAFVRALAAIAGVGKGGEVRDLLPAEEAPVYLYPVRHQRREAPAAAILAEVPVGDDPERSLISWLGGLQPGGVLVAVLPNRFLAEAGAAAFRQRFLAQGQLLAAITLPGGLGVCLFRKRDRQPASTTAAPTALLISPTMAVTTPAARERYLADVLARARECLAPEAL